MPTSREFGAKMKRIERLLQDAQEHPEPAVRQMVRQIVEGLMDMHSAGLKTILQCLAETGQSKAFIDKLADDELVSALLVLYGLHPLDLQTRVARALDKCRPYLASHGGNVELLEIADGVVRLQLQGSCHGCPSSAVTLRTAIEEAISAMAPDVAAIEVEGQSPAPTAAPGGLDTPTSRVALPVMQG